MADNRMVKSREITEYNEWMEQTPQGVRVGLMPQAVQELEEIVFVELPTVGREVESGEMVAILETTKAAVDLYSPIKGRISGINEKLVQQPNLILQDPENQGWIYSIQPEK